MNSAVVSTSYVAEILARHRLKVGWFRTACLCGWTPTREVGNVYRDRQHREHVARQLEIATIERERYVCHAQGPHCCWDGCPRQYDDRSEPGCFLAKRS